MRYVLWEDPAFEPLLTHPVLLGLVTHLVGFDAILSLYDAMLKGPGGRALPLHTDNGDLATPVYADQPQSANINLLLSDYGEGSGPIAFLPGSHRFRRQPTAAEVRGLGPELVPVIAPAGSAVIWPANTWHVARPRGFSWSLGGWLLTPFLRRVGEEGARRLRQRVADELTTTFASTYTRTVSLAEALDPDTVRAYHRKATGEKYLIDPSA